MDKKSFQPKGYIFDYGGTLDTNGNHWGKVIWHAYQRQDVPISEDDFREAYVFAERKLGSERIIMPDFSFRQTLSKKIEIELGYLVYKGVINISQFEVEKLHAAILTDLYNGVKQTTAHSVEVLTQLKKKCEGMVLVSNFYGNMHEVLKEFGFEGLFSHIIESAVVGIRKPNPQIFQLGVDALKLNASDILVVGDSYPKDIVPAKQTGCMTCWMKGEGWTDDEPDGKAADFVINDLTELL